MSAIKTAIVSKFSVITGGQGVGKTTITKAIIDIFKLMNKKNFSNPNGESRQTYGRILQS